MSKNLRRLTLLLAAVFVMMIMAVPAFADADSSYYVIGDRSIPAYATTDQINVKLHVQSRASSASVQDATIINSIYNVTLTGQTSYTVRDVLRTFNTSGAGIKAGDTSGNELSASATTVGSFFDNNYIFKYLLFADLGLGYGREPVDGWMFRINGKYPLISTNGYLNGPKGGYIHETPVADGDVISFYFNCPFVINGTDCSTAFVAAYSSYSSGQLNVQLKSCHENHGDSTTGGVWVLDDYENYSTFNTSSPVGTLYDANFNSVGTINFSSTGSGTLNTTLNSGTYYLYVPSTISWRILSGYSSFSGSGTTSCICMKSTAVFDRVVIG